ncbi:MAG: hypothetical protein M9933_19105 [Chitinophagaceae bacterium]|nr:hypothetical protein [Chitinophagaceae bacterium]
MLKLKTYYMCNGSRLGIISRDRDADANKLTAVETNLGNTYLLTFTRGNKFFEMRSIRHDQ